jgi:glycosyltransferase involved in cell wall biosynthesis
MLKQQLAISFVTGTVNNLKFDTKETLQKYLLIQMVTSDVVIAQMPSRIITMPLFEFAKAKGKKILIETDDLVHKLHDGFSAEKRQQREANLDNLKKLWSMADGFICSTPELARIYSDLYGKPAKVFHNYIDFDDPRWDIKKVDNSKLVIGWMGGDSHDKDLRIIEPVISAILAKYDVAFQFVTYCPDWLKPKLGANIRYIPTSGSMESYTPMIAQFDIGIAPVLDNEFNRCKSDLKYLEYSRLKVPTIASKANVYTSITNKVNGLLVRNTVGDWVKAISELIENEMLRKGLAIRAYNYVKDVRDIKDNAYKYVETINKLICK